jgi:transposase
LPDGQIIMSFLRAGRVCAAQNLVELGDVRERFPRAEQLAAEAGAMPVNWHSGKTRNLSFRWTCNHRLRRVITCLADNARYANA